METPSIEDIKQMDYQLSSPSENGYVRFVKNTNSKEQEIDRMIFQFHDEVKKIGHDDPDKHGNRFLTLNNLTVDFMESGGFKVHFDNKEKDVKSKAEKETLEHQKLKSELILIKKSIDDLNHKKGMRPVEKLVMYSTMITAIIGTIVAIFATTK